MARATLVVPVAGRGSRIHSICANQPKCLMAVGGRPILHYVLDAGLQAPVERIVIVINSVGNAVVSTIGDEYAGVPVYYVLQPSPMGLAHAVTLAEPYVSDAMLVINGDEIFVKCKHRSAWRHFVESEADAVVGYIRTDKPERITIGYGMDLAFDGRVLRLEEKPAIPRNDVLGVGTWLLRRTWFDFYESTSPSPLRGERDFVSVIQKMLDCGNIIHSFDLSGWFFNINTPADLLEAGKMLDPNTRASQTSQINVA
jgi:glucose-1-phosphate thymidylyltransferase